MGSHGSVSAVLHRLVSRLRRIFVDELFHVHHGMLRRRYRPTTAQQHLCCIEVTVLGYPKCIVVEGEMQNESIRQF